MTDSTHSSAVAVACNMTDAPDSLAERLEAYQSLFADALLARERTDAGIRFRFRAEADVQARAEQLAAREKACCAFFEFEITRQGGEIWWDATVIDDETARRVLEEFFQLPETIGGGARELHGRFSASGLEVVVDEHGARRALGADEVISGATPPRRETRRGEDGCD